LVLAVALTVVAVTGGQRAPAASLVTAPITVSNAGHGSVTSTPSGISCGTLCTSEFNVLSQVTLAAVPESGYTVRWSGPCVSTTATSCTVIVDNAKTVTAIFEQPRLTVTLQDTSVPPAASPRGWVTSFGVNGGLTSPEGIDCGSACSASFAAGTVVTLWPISFPGSAFARWSGDLAAGPSACSDLLCTVTLTQSRTIVAVFEAASGPVDFQTTFTVGKTGTGAGRVTSRPPGISCGSGSQCAAGYPTNVNVTLTATADEGSTFAGWGGPCAGAGTRATCVVTVGPALTAAARFDKTLPPAPPEPPKPPAPPKPPDPPKAPEPEPPNPADPPKAIDPPKEIAPAKPAATTTIAAGAISVRVARSGTARSIWLRVTLRKNATCTVRLLRSGRPVLRRAMTANAGPHLLRVVIPKTIRHGRFRVSLVLAHGRAETQRLSWPVRL